ncbi:hypothetical protein ACSVIJ_12135 [Pseudomonas sp. NCHU5208]|uniref:hypothetical protein n=1 Tax=unclassified Pseudomonas TaxID=196821 RepID=UPI003F960617
MNRSDLPNREVLPPMQWPDAPISPLSDRDVMEWEAAPLLPQMAAALERPCSAASSYRLLDLWRALRTSIRQPAAGAARH